MMALFCKEKTISSWGVLYSLPHQNEMLEPLLPMHSPEKKLPDFVTVSENVIWEENKDWTYIPVWYQENHYFTLVLFTNSLSLSKETFEDFRFYLQTLLAFEISRRPLYPSFYPLLYSSLGEFHLLNHRIREKNHFYFLNGQEGTGKKTFVQSFLLYHFYYYFRITSEGENFRVVHFRDEQENALEIWWVTELAYLEMSWQEKIFSSSSPLRFIFVSSVYSADALLQGELIHKHMHTLCIRNQVLFPSLSRRLPELRNLLTFACRYRFESKTFSYELSENLREQVEKGNIVQNLRGLFQYFENLLNPTEGQQSFFDVRGRKLEDLIIEMEKAAIKAAYKAVGKSQQKIAEYLGISRGSLQYKIRQYNIPYQDWEEL